MKILIQLFVFLTCECLLAQSDSQTVSGRIINRDTNEAIPYASVVYLGTSVGTTSSKDGSFQIKKSLNASESKLYISSIGYQDTLVSLTVLESDIFIDIELRPKVYQIELVTVKSPYTKKEEIGSKNYPVSMSMGKSIGFAFSSPGWGNGVMIIPDKSQEKGMLSSLDIYIADEGPLNNSFVIRIVVPSEKMKPNRMYNLADVRDLVTEPVIFKPESRGWNKIELYDLGILIPEEPFVVLFTALDEGSAYEWVNDGGGKKYGSVIASTSKSNVPQIKWVINTGDSFGYISSSRGVSNTPMVVLNCLTQ